MSEPLIINGKTLVWILLGGPILPPSCQYQSKSNMKTVIAYPYLEIDLNRSTFKFKCSHLLTTIPPPGTAAPPGVVSPSFCPDWTCC